MAERDGPRRRTQGVAGTWPPRGAAQGAALAPSGAAWSSFLERLQAWVRAEAGAGRLLPGFPSPLAQAWRSISPRRASRCSAVSIATAIAAMHRRLPVAAKPVLCGGCDGRGRLGGLCHGDLQDRAHDAHRAGAADLFGVAVRLCRDPRHPRAHRPLRAARDHDGCAAAVDETRARAAVGEEGHRARRRQLCRAEGAAVAAARAVAAGLL